ncbi:MAG: MGH1-like glycoside hydrolase domain-containing protein [Promethearchaeota archaeon]
MQPSQIDRGSKKRLSRYDPPEYAVEEDPLAYPFLQYVKIPQSPPTVVVPHHHWAIPLDGLWENMLWDVMAPYKIFQNTWHRPGPAWVGTWLWDNAFHSKVWSLCNVDFAEYILESHMKFQDVSDPFDNYNYGRIPHSIEGGKINDWTQPPLMAWAFWEVFKKNGSTDMLAWYFPFLFSYHTWLNYNRDLNRDGLYSWVHGFESGLDNAPRYDTVSSLECDAVDFSSCVSVQLGSLVKMARVLKDDVSVESLSRRKAELDGWINEDLWDDDVSFYFDKAFEGDRKGEFIGPKMISGWYPLFAGVVPRERLAKYLAHLTDKREFWGDFPVATVAMDEESFDNEMNMWRGPTWINTNYMIIKGLKGYGFRALPGELAYITVKNVFDVYNKNGMFYEYYGSVGGNDNIEHFSRKNEKSGPRPYFGGWTGLTANLLFEDILGFEVQAGAIMLDPSIPESFIANLDGGMIRGTLPGIPLWLSGEIGFTIEFTSKEFVNYQITLPKPVDVYVVDYHSEEAIYNGDNIKIIDIEVKNNKDVLAILSSSDGIVVKDEFKFDDQE